MELLSEAKPPYFILRSSPRKRFVNEEYYTAPTSIVRKIRGDKAQSFDAMMDEFGAAFQFSDEFGENWHALEELLCYMDEWLPASGYVVVVTEAERLLVRQPEQFEWFVRGLNDVGNWWAQPVVNNDRFDRPPRPFKVVLEVQRDKAQRIAESIRKMGIDVAIWPED